MAGKAARIAGLRAQDLRAGIAKGALRVEEVAEALIARVAETEPGLSAWAWFDPDFVRSQARALDAHRAAGRPLGALHGLPVGVKDVIDTARIPTENGTVIDAGRIPAEDAFVVSRLKAAGAIVFGKTRTTELAFLAPGPTRNPANPAHTPGGSSSGSAAAVASGQVPLALGTQTAGSVIRPAAFCGTVGFKPSFGAIPRTGVLAQAPSLDTIGVFARSVPDAALLDEVLFGDDPRDAATAPAPPPRLFELASAPPPVAPVFALVQPPGWERAEEETRLALAEVAGLLGEQCFEVALPGAFAEGSAARECIQLAELSKCFYGYERRGRAQLSTEMQGALDRGKAIPARDYIAALDWRRILNAALEEVFARCDAILVPAAPGPAPEGLGMTGDPVFNGLWTLCGTPAVTIPVLEASNGLPMGLQLVGRRGDDGRLLRSARWLMERLRGEDSGQGDLR